MENISRRNFMKGVGAVALATAATGLLSGCGDGGLIVEEGSPAEVLGAPQHERTRAFLSRYSG